MSAIFPSHCISFHQMEKNTLQLAVTMSQLKRIKSINNDIKMFAKTDRGCLAWYTLVYLVYIMYLSYVHPQITIIQHLYLKSSFWCALLLKEFMFTRSANTEAKKLFWLSANLSLELVTVSKCPRADHSHGCWVSFTPIFIKALQGSTFLLSPFDHYFLQHSTIPAFTAFYNTAELKQWMLWDVTPQKHSVSRWYSGKVK